jgi:putative nucleotidyltransferase with HDIG domain
MSSPLTTDRIEKALSGAKPLSFKINTLTPQIEKNIEKLLFQILKYLSLDHWHRQFTYCIRELVKNAQFLNIFHLYLKDRGFKDSDFSQFGQIRKEYNQNIDVALTEYDRRQTEEGLHLKIQFLVKDEKLCFLIRNSISLSDSEKGQIENFSKSLSKAVSIDKIMGQFDPDIKHGMGVIIIAFMIAKFGWGKDVLNVKIEDNETVTSFCVDLEAVRLSNIKMLSEKIAGEIELLPPIPANLLKIQELIKDEKAQLQDIANQVAIDPYLSADLLKLVNSSAFMVSYKISSIIDAVKYLGLKELQHLVLSFGVREVLQDHDKAYEQLWEHSYRTAYYACSIATKLKIPPHQTDSLYSCALLHDIGKIPFSTLYPALVNSLESFCSTNDILLDLLEETISGTNHAVIGAKMAEKWNFPPVLTTVIRLHHSPAQVTGEHRTIASLVYLANCYENYENGIFNLEDIDREILSEKGFEGPVDFFETFKDLKDLFAADSLM